MRMGGSLSSGGAVMARTASLCLGLSLASLCQSGHPVAGCQGIAGGLSARNIMSREKCEKKFHSVGKIQTSTILLCHSNNSGLTVIIQYFEKLFNIKVVKFEKTILRELKRVELAQKVFIFCFSLLKFPFAT